MINVRIGTEIDIQKITDTYSHVKSVVGENGYLIIAETDNEIVGFLWAFKRKIPAPIEQEEIFINVIEVFNANLRCKGIGSMLLAEIARIAKEQGIYQLRAYCDIKNVSSHRLWIKNKFSISPVKMPDDTIAGSFVSSIL